MRHIHDDYDGPPAGCPHCAESIACPVCGGLNTRATRCGFCFEPLTRKEGPRAL